MPKCNDCKKEKFMLEFDEGHKSCKICVLKQQARRDAKRETRRQEQSLLKEQEIKKPESMPWMLQSYSNMCEEMSLRGVAKPTFQEYQDYVKKWNELEINREAEQKELERKDPSFAVPVNPNDICGEVRLRRMAGSPRIPEDSFHIQNCHLCRRWIAVWHRNHGKSFEGVDLWGHQENKPKPTNPDETSGWHDRPDLDKILKEEMDK
jgi:hypothetical protein